jgi:hypothetical protein
MGLAMELVPKRAAQYVPIMIALLSAKTLNIPYSFLITTCQAHKRRFSVGNKGTGEK